MPHTRRREREEVEIPGNEEVAEAAGYISMLRKKSLATVLTVLVTLYSFFSAIYRIPVALEQHAEKIAHVEETSVKDGGRITAIETTLAVKEADFRDMQSTRNRVEILERSAVDAAVMRLQVQRLEEAAKDLTKAVESLSLRLTELNANVNALKDTNAETRRAVEAIKRKSP